MRKLLSLALLVVFASSADAQLLRRNRMSGGACSGGSCGSSSQMDSAQMMGFYPATNYSLPTVTYSVPSSGFIGSPSANTGPCGFCPAGACAAGACMQGCPKGNCAALQNLIGSQPGAICIDGKCYIPAPANTTQVKATTNVQPETMLITTDPPIPAPKKIVFNGTDFYPTRH